MTHPTPPELVALLADELAQEIRRVDGSHTLGAGALAEALAPFIIDVSTRAATVPQGVWLPIESAPRDGTVVLFCDARGNRWSDCSPGVLANGCGYPATHWQPLPTPPAAELVKGDL